MLERLYIMIFKSLKEKCEYYRNLTDYRLIPNGYVLVMIDGKNFSKLIKNKFEKPFDNWFIDTMNQTAEHLCKNIQNVIGAYVQSDEISLVIKDNSLTSMPYDGRLCKLLSIIPATATAFFNRKMIERFIKDLETKDEINTYLNDMPDYLFDCKVWSVPNENDAMAWFLYRQIDCIRNSKQQFCQTYLPHKTLLNKHTDEQVNLCIANTGYNWNLISDDKKFGRFLYKKLEEFENENGEPYFRNKWKIASYELTDDVYREGLKRIWFKDDEIGHK